MTGHDRFRDATAAYVIGALEADEREELVSHLRECEGCRDDVVTFAPLPSLLARLDADDLAPTPEATTADGVVAAVRADLARLARSRRRWRWLAGAAAAVAVLAGAAVALDDEPSRGDRGVPLEVAAAAGTDATIVADERPWGTYVHVSAEGLPHRPEYELWLVDADGRWHPAGTFAPSPDGSVRLGGSSRLELAAIDRVVITSSDKTDELVTTVRQR